MSAGPDAESPRIARFLAEARPATPCLVLDLDMVAARYRAFGRAFPDATVFYAVKANGAPPVLDRLAGLGCRFDVASPGEIDAVLGLGVSAARVSYGSTIKKRADVALAHARGIRLFAFDSEAELLKLAAAAPGSEVFCRIAVDCTGADWPLSRKFGCRPEKAVALLARAPGLGLVPAGVSFHVGSQQTDPGEWRTAIGQAAGVFRALAGQGIGLRLLNLGGGFPARYRTPVPPLEAYAAAIAGALDAHFGDGMPEIFVEPGRGMVGDAGLIEAEVVLVATRDDPGGPRRWVYLDVGKFSGLAETIGEAIRYRVRTPRDGGPAGPAVLAGPTCDSADILYESAVPDLPLDLAVGDRIRLLSAGAYTAAYSSVGFNGFPPLPVHCI